MSQTSGTSLLTYLQNAKIPKSFSESFIDIFYPQISKTDIDNGYIVRYFAKQTNHTSTLSIREIDFQTYSKLNKNALYQTISIQWKIRGNIDDVPGPIGPNAPVVLFVGVKNGNIRAVVEANKEMNGLIFQLQNPLQFYQGA